VRRESPTYYSRLPFESTVHYGSDVQRATLPSPMHLRPSSQTGLVHQSLPQEAYQQEYATYGITLGANPHGDSLPPPRTLPFKAKSKASALLHLDPEEPTRQRHLSSSGGIRPQTSNNMTALNSATLGDAHGTPQSPTYKKSTNRGDSTAMKPQCYEVLKDQVRPIEAHSGPETGTVACKPVAAFANADDVVKKRQHRGGTVLEPPSESGDDIMGIVCGLQGAIQKCQVKLADNRTHDVDSIFQDLQTTVQKLQTILRSRHSQNINNDLRENNRTNSRETTARNSLVKNTTQSEACVVPHRRHTKEYKQWRDYYLFACRLYDTKEERTDAEFIHKFLRGIPSTRILRWVQMGLLNCYPSMVRLSTRRSGTSVIFTRDLRWSQVCDMVTRKLRLPFPKWETV
jgi:hypothetical protein